LSTIPYPAFLRQIPDVARVEGFVHQLNANFEVIIGFLKLVPEEKVRLRVGLLSINTQPLSKFGRNANTEPERVESWPPSSFCAAMYLTTFVDANSLQRPEDF